MLEILILILLIVFGTPLIAGALGAAFMYLSIGMLKILHFIKGD